MTVHITRKTTAQEFDQLLKQAQGSGRKPRKPFPADEFVGKVKFPKDAVELQNEWRDDWGQ
jgi:hypothetical protein